MDASHTKQLAMQALDRLMAEVEAGHSDQLKAYLAMLARFHRYSWGNVLLIGMQFPTAQQVAGYRAWQRIGRQVRQGEKAIRILAPIVRRKELDDQETVVAFRSASVFDVSQTEGKRLPTFAEIRGDPGLYLDQLKALVARKGIKLSYSGALGPAEGASAGGQIVLRSGLDAATEFSVLAHELAHEMLHRKEQDAPGSKTVRETEAEAVAFIVCQAIGMESGSASSDYVQLYQGKKETLVASLERIQRTGTEIIASILPQATDADTGDRAASAGRTGTPSEAA
jgi:hypothetical protein